MIVIGMQGHAWVKVISAFWLDMGIRSRHMKSAQAPSIVPGLVGEGLGVESPGFARLHLQALYAFLLPGGGMPSK